MNEEQRPEKTSVTEPYSETGAEHVYPLPPDYDIARLAKALAEWFESAHKQETATIDIPDGVVVQAKDAGGALSRLIRRKSEMIHVALTVRENNLVVRPGPGKWEHRKENRSAPGISGIRGAAAATLNAATGLAGKTIDGISEMFAEKDLAEAVYQFVASHIRNHIFGNKTAPIRAIDTGASRYAESVSDVQSVWLAAYLAPDEIPIAWLNTSTGSSAPSQSDWVYLLTTRRSALAAFSKNRFEAVRELPDAPMLVRDEIGRDTVIVGNMTFRTRRHNDVHFREIAPLHQLTPEERLYESARLNFLHLHGAENQFRMIQNILKYLADQTQNPIYALCRLYAGLNQVREKQTDVFENSETHSEIAAAVRTLPSAVTPNQFLRWAADWDLRLPERLTLCRLILEFNPDSPPHAELILPLIQETRYALSKDKKEKIRSVPADICAAETLKRCGNPAEASRILNARLSQLPDETLADLLPGQNADLTKGESGQLIRIRILEMLSDINGTDGKPDTDRLAELAVLQPLVPQRLRRITECGDGDLRETAAAALKLLEPGGLAPSEQDSRFDARKKAFPITPDDIENKIRHPASRKGTLLNRIQQMLASSETADHTALKSYARRASAATHPEIHQAVADGVILLGMKSAEVFISYGDLNTGVRGYDASPPFVLIGSGHVEDGSAHQLSHSELRFMIGAELAHLKFGHERITSRDVWEGTFDKAMTLIEFVPIAGPCLSKLGQLGKIAGQATELTQKLIDSQNYIRKALSFATSAQNLLLGKSKKSVTLSDDEQHLISAFREMQLTADRAALVISGNLKSAVRAIFKSDPKLIAELPLAETCGLDAFLSRKNDSGELIFQNLAIRLAALFSFYLSQDYRSLTKRS